MNPDDPRHGRNKGYAAHMYHRVPPCQPCRDAHARAVRRWQLLHLSGRRLSVPSVGVKRRIRALSRLGWTQDQIAAAGGWKSARNVRDLLERDECYVTTWRRIVAVYDELSMKVPPSSRGSSRARSHAEAMGWPPPLAWDDETIDDPKARPKGHGPDRVRRDVAAEVAHLTSLGVSIHQAARQLGVTVAAIERAQERARGAA